MCDHLLCKQLKSHQCHNVDTVAIAPVLIYNLYRDRQNSFGALGVGRKAEGFFQGQYDLPTFDAAPIAVVGCYWESLRSLLWAFKFDTQMDCTVDIDSVFAAMDGSFIIKKYNTTAVVLLRLTPGFSRKPIKAAILQEMIHNPQTFSGVITDFEYARLDTGAKVDEGLRITSEFQHKIQPPFQLTGLADSVRQLITLEDLQKFY